MYMRQSVFDRRLDSTERCGSRVDLEPAFLKPRTRPWEKGEGEGGRRVELSAVGSSGAQH